MAEGNTSQGPWPSPPRARFAGLRDHARVARESLEYLSSRLATSLLVWLLIGIALALPAGLYLLQQNLASMTGEWQGRPGVSVYFARDVSQAQIAAAVEKAESASFGCPGMAHITGRCAGRVSGIFRPDRLPRPARRESAAALA